LCEFDDCESLLGFFLLMYEVGPVVGVMWDRLFVCFFLFVFYLFAVCLSVICLLFLTVCFCLLFIFVCLFVCFCFVHCLSVCLLFVCSFF
jgi:hypothetical protein